MTHPLTTTLTKRSSDVTLSREEISRYSRQILLPEVGLEGQKRLKAARVLIIGMGGLGSPASLYLAGAGVGTLGLAEFDQVDISNLQRQILYTSADQGTPKLLAAANHLRCLNPHVDIVEHPIRVDATNVQDLISGYDLVLDGTDNLATRYLVADACGLGEKPLVYGAVFRFGGQVSVFYSPFGPCYRCLFPKPPAPEDVPSCAEAGILGVMPGQVGIMQATEALKLILGVGSPLMGRLLTIDGRTGQYSEFQLPRDPQCPLCGSSPSITTLHPLINQCSMTKALSQVAGTSDEDDENAPSHQDQEIDADALERLRASNPNLLIIDVRSAEEAAICAIPGHLLVPLQELPQKIPSLPKDVPIIFYCKTGRRSREALRVSRDYGLTNIKSLKNGILSWAATYLPEAAQY